MSKTILAVDDSASVRQLVTFTLKNAGYDAVSAPDGKTALEKLDSLDVKMLITDLNMPGIDGIELIKQVRSDPRYKFMPILMLSTESQNQKKEEGKKAGATGWIVKPFQPDQLLSVIKKLLR